MARTDRFPLTGGTVHSRPERASRVPRQETPSQTQPDLFDYEPPILKTHLLPEEAPLLVVTTRVFAEAERPDGWLYILLPAEQGWRLIDNGLKLDAREPLVFCERPALLPLFAAQADEYDKRDMLLLRVRKAHVAPWLDSDPDSSAQLGTSCYLLSRQTPIG